MTKLEFITVGGFAMLVLLHVTQSEVCPASCSCKSLGEAQGLHVDCSSRQLKAVPALPRATQRLYLHNNSLSAVPAGALDSLLSLQELNVSDNPWHCDCHIMYLKLWLEDFSAPSLANIRCATPAPVRMKALRQLTGNELGVCKRLLPVKCLEFLWRDLILIAGAIITLLLLAWALKFSKKMVCQLKLSQYRPRGRLLRRHISKNHKIQ